MRTGRTPPTSSADEGGESACWAHLLPELDLASGEAIDPESVDGGSVDPDAADGSATSRDSA